MARMPPVPKRPPKPATPTSCATPSAPRRCGSASMPWASRRRISRPRRGASGWSSLARSSRRASRATWAGSASAPRSAPIRRPCGREARTVVVARAQLRPAIRSARRARAARARGDLGLRPGPRLPRGGEDQAQGARPLHLGHLPPRHQGVRRHRAADGEARRAGRRARLAGQAHQPRVAAMGLVAVPRRAAAVEPSCPATIPRSTIAATAAPASTPARPTPSRRPTSSMRGAASPTSPSSTKARSTRRCARCSATAFMAATIASPPARGTSSRRTPAKRPSPRARSSTAPALAELATLDDAAFRAPLRRHRHQAHRPRPIHSECRLCAGQQRRARGRPGRSTFAERRSRRWCARQPVGHCRA